MSQVPTQRDTSTDTETHIDARARLCAVCSRGDRGCVSLAVWSLQPAAAAASSARAVALAKVPRALAEMETETAVPAHLLALLDPCVQAQAILQPNFYSGRNIPAHCEPWQSPATIDHRARRSAHQRACWGLCSVLGALQRIHQDPECPAVPAAAAAAVVQVVSVVRAFPNAAAAAQQAQFDRPASSRRRLRSQQRR